MLPDRTVVFNCARVTRDSELIGTARSSRCSSRSTRDTRSIRGDQLDNRCRRRHLIFWGAAAGIASGGPAGSSRLAEEDNRPVDHHRTVGDTGDSHPVVGSPGEDPAAGSTVGQTFCGV